MVEENSKHDEYNKCGQPDFLPDDFSGITRTGFERKSINITAKQLTEAHCKCCGGDLNITITNTFAITCGASAIISCPKCISETLKEQKGEC